MCWQNAQGLQYHLGHRVRFQMADLFQVAARISVRLSGFSFKVRRKSLHKFCYCKTLMEAPNLYNLQPQAPDPRNHTLNSTLYTCPFLAWAFLPILAYH